MRSNKPDIPKTKVNELYHHLELLDKILAPTIINPIRMLVSEAMQETEKKAKDQRMSKELQELEPMLEQFRYCIKTYGEAEVRSYLWHMRPIIKKIIELYGKNEEQCR